MERIIAGALMLLSVVYIAASWRLPRFQMSTVVDAHIFPIATGIVLFVLAVLLWFHSSVPVRLPERWRSSALVALLLLGYALVLEPLGFLVATTAFILSTAAVLGWRRWGSALLVSVGFAAGTYYIFGRLLSLRLPSGILPWLGG